MQKILTSNSFLPEKTSPFWLQPRHDNKEDSVFCSMFFQGWDNDYVPPTMDHTLIT